MNLSQSSSHLNGEWYGGIGAGIQVATVLVTLVASLLLTRAYIRRRNSVLQSLQGPPSSSFIFGGFLRYTLATYTRLSRRHRK